MGENMFEIKKTAEEIVLERNEWQLCQCSDLGGCLLSCPPFCHKCVNSAARPQTSSRN